MSPALHNEVISQLLTHIGITSDEKRKAELEDLCKRVILSSEAAK